MYTAKLTIRQQLSGHVEAEHTISGAANAEQAYLAAVELSSNIERMYSTYTDHDITIYKNGILVDADDYAECWRIVN